MADYHVVYAESADDPSMYKPWAMRFHRGPSTWTEEEYTFFAAQIRTGIGMQPRRVDLRVSPTALAVCDPKTGEVESEHPFTSVKTYQADTARHSFAWSEIPRDASGEPDPGKPYIVNQIFLSDPKKLHLFVTDTVRALAKKIKAEKEARKARKAAKKAAREAEKAIAAAHPRPLTPPPGAASASSATRKSRSRASSASSSNPPPNLGVLLDLDAVQEAIEDHHDDDDDHPDDEHHDRLQDLLNVSTGDISALSPAEFSPLHHNPHLRERRNSLAEALERRPSADALTEASILQDDDAFFAALHS